MGRLKLEDLTKEVPVVELTREIELPKELLEKTRLTGPVCLIVLIWPCSSLARGGELGIDMDIIEDATVLSQIEDAGPRLPTGGGPRVEEALVEVVPFDAAELPRKTSTRV